MSIEKLNALTEELEAHRKNVATKTKNLLKEICDDVFKRYDQVYAIGWQQWIPGFNDGDPCTFTMGEVVFLEKPEIDSDEEDDILGELSMREDYCMTGGTWNSETKKYEYPHLPEGMADYLHKVAGALQGASDFMESMFGSNAEIVITREKLTVREYGRGY